MTVENGLSSLQLHKGQVFINSVTCDVDDVSIVMDDDNFAVVLESFVIIL